MNPQPYQTFGPYELISRLGAGGMGEVYRARDTRLNREVAIKVLPKDFVTDADRLRRFEQEAKSLAALNHPNVLTIHDAGVHDGAPYLVSELLEGRTLREEMNNGKVPARKATEYALQIAQGLAAAHAKCIIHRDLKPENLFVTSAGRMKILDFGLAKLQVTEESPAPEGTTLPESTLPGRLLGTPGYMSPEQVRGEPADHRSDIFSLGVVFGELFGGQHPFRRETAVETMSAILREEPTLPLGRLGNAEAALHRIIQRCLEKEPDRRFQSAQDLAFAIESATTSGDTCTELTEARAQIEPVAKPLVKSVAVLPFLNISSDSENEFLCDGISEELGLALSRLPGLRVPARTSAFSFKGRHEDIRKIGKALNVAHVLEGSVRKSGSRLRITAKLITVDDGFPLWSEKYDRQMEDVFAIQDEITQAIVAALEVHLTSSRGGTVPHRHLDNPEAYQLYLQGLFHFHQWTREGFLRSIQLFEQALRSEPSYALAQAGISLSCLFGSFYGHLRPYEAFSRMKASAEKAVEVDPSLAEAQAALAMVRAWYDWDTPGAERAFGRAIELNPSYATARNLFGFYLACKGRRDDAMRELRRAADLDPLSLMIQLHSGYACWFIGDLNGMEAHARSMVAMDPRFFGAQWLTGWTKWQKGEPDAAIIALQRAVEQGGGPLPLADLACICGRAGHLVEARHALAQLNELSGRTYVPACYRAFAYAGLNETETALAWFKQASEERHGSLVYAPLYCANAGLNQLRSDPRFQAIFTNVGLKP